MLAQFSFIFAFNVLVVEIGVGGHWVRLQLGVCLEFLFLHSRTTFSHPAIRLSFNLVQSFFTAPKIRNSKIRNSEKFESGILVGVRS